MAIIHTIAEVVVFFAAICVIYYFFQITQAQGVRKQNLKYLGLSVLVLLVAYPTANLSGKKDVSPTNQVSNQVRKTKKRRESESREQSRKESAKKASTRKESRSTSK
ncbi:hypothetical protein FD13_GL000102 [Levilactobacillus senmaizukei DSM 21775 = NBRC 103853]|uniref:Uncharacterized protein n=1 Tax=Levilactobacillus senmaizukei DSM 21775 = NBRC 103853 TaxID=1423803 RepID=A0A0R2DR61_9LACO|nr:hypothetical protein [Levilactobacillus senmaizukei]KRN03319.1 hypothetical protein FD13_GL000102 [Levilactobacillus senmaizukei DSM 21775 = NBRC 103853]